MFGLGINFGIQVEQIQMTFEQELINSCCCNTEEYKLILEEIERVNNYEADSRVLFERYCRNISSSLEQDEMVQNAIISSLKKCGYNNNQDIMQRLYRFNLE